MSSTTPANLCVEHKPSKFVCRAQAQQAHMTCYTIKFVCPAQSKRTNTSRTILSNLCVEYNPSKFVCRVQSQQMHTSRTILSNLCVENNPSKQTLRILYYLICVLSTTSANTHTDIAYYTIKFVGRALSHKASTPRTIGDARFMAMLPDYCKPMAHVRLDFEFIKVLPLKKSAESPWNF